MRSNENEDPISAGRLLVEAAFITLVIIGWLGLSALVWVVEL